MYPRAGGFSRSISVIVENLHFARARSAYPLMSSALLSCGYARRCDCVLSHNPKIDFYISVIMSGLCRNKVTLSCRGEGALLDPPPRDVTNKTIPTIVGVMVGIAHAHYYEDNRRDSYKMANLYYLYLTTGTDSRFTITTMIAGRPFRSYVKLNGRLLFEQNGGSFKWNSLEQNGVSDIKETLTQWLADSGEIQYCAAAAGIPYDVVGIIELLILAIV